MSISYVRESNSFRVRVMRDGKRNDKLFRIDRDGAAEALEAAKRCEDKMLGSDVRKSEGAVSVVNIDGEQFVRCQYVNAKGKKRYAKVCSTEIGVKAATKEAKRIARIFGFSAKEI